MGNLVAFISGNLVAAFSSWLANFFSVRRDRRNEFKSAQKEFIEAFFDEIIGFERSVPLEIKGTEIYDVLMKAYPKHCAAVYRFRSQLNRWNKKETIGFDSVWEQHKYPENNKQGTFGFYITPDRNRCNPLVSADFVLHKINLLMNYANQ